jgi:hypothetical protein
MGIGKKMSKGSIGGGVNISHKSKMSQSAKNQMSFPGGMPGPGDYGKVVGKGMAKYLSGESVGMKKYGKHKGTAKMDPMHNGEPGVQKEDFQQFSDGPTKRTRAERQADRDSKKTTRRAKRADKRVKRNEDKVKKLESKIDQGKENFNVDDAGNKTTGRKANRIKRAKKKIEDNKKISQKGKDLKKKKEEETAKKKVDQADKNLKKLNFKSTKKADKESSSGKDGAMKAGNMKKVKKVNEMSNRRRKDTYSYQEPKAKVLKK